MSTPAASSSTDDEQIARSHAFWDARREPGGDSVDSAGSNFRNEFHRQVQEEARTLRLARDYIKEYEARSQDASPLEPNEDEFAIKLARTYVANRAAFEDYINGLRTAPITGSSTHIGDRRVYHEMDQPENIQQCTDCKTYVPKILLDKNGICDRCTLFYVESDLRKPKPCGPGGEANFDANEELRMMFSQSIKLLTAVCRYLGRRQA